MLKFAISGKEIKSIRVNFGLLVLRLFAGFSMAFVHGYGKIPPSEGFINGVEKMGFPIPSFFAWSAGISEFIGGILLGLGLLTRPSAFFLAITMFVAAFIRHSDDPFVNKEKALLFMIVFILFLLAGSGRYGIDKLLRKR